VHNRQAKSKHKMQRKKRAIVVKQSSLACFLWIFCMTTSFVGTFLQIRAVLKHVKRQEAREHRGSQEKFLGPGNNENLIRERPPVAVVRNQNQRGKVQRAARSNDKLDKEILANMDPRVRQKAMEMMNMTGAPQESMSEHEKQNMELTFGGIVSDVFQVYGSEPSIQGLDQCEAFRSSVAPKDRIVAPAG
jgi:hypothetical protein